jgi:hypothetical protein
MLPSLERECSEFLEISQGIPLLKSLPKARDGFLKVKVRQKKRTDYFANAFNDAFADTKPRLLQRSVFAHGEASFVPLVDPNTEPFYVFPINGFRYMYNQHTTSNLAYQDTLQKIESAIQKDSALQLFRDILKTDYVFDNLPFGISTGCEIIIYDIPYYYAVRKSLIDDYSEFLIT